jgi:hypothetical protein
MIVIIKLFSQFMESKSQGRTRFGEGHGSTTKYHSEDVFCYLERKKERHL